MKNEITYTEHNGLYYPDLALPEQTNYGSFPPTVHLKGVTHYTLQGKACEKEYEQMPVLLLFFRQVKPALWKAPLVLPFFVDLGKFLLSIEIFAHIKVFAHR